MLLVEDALLLLPLLKGELVGRLRTGCKYK